MELNAFFQPLNAPVTNTGVQTGYDFLTNTESGALISQGLFGTAVVGDVNISNLSAAKILAGTITVALGIGGANVTIDGSNNRIIVNNGTTDVCLFGKF